MKTAITILAVSIAALFFAGPAKRFDHPTRHGLPLAWREHVALEGLSLARYYCQDQGFADVLRIAPGKTVARASRMWDKPCEGKCEVFEFIECTLTPFEERELIASLRPDFFQGDWEMSLPSEWRAAGGTPAMVLRISSGGTFTWGSEKGTWKRADDEFALVLATAPGREIRMKPDTARIRGGGGDRIFTWDGFVRKLGVKR